MRNVEVAGVRLSAIGLGTWQFGSAEWGYGADYAAVESARLVERALDLGVNLIDTAEVYAWGQSERLVGAALGDRRDEAFVATKLFPVAPVASVVVQRAQASSERLGVTAIDLYQMHWRNSLVPLSATMAGMRSLLDDGSVRHVGVSNLLGLRLARRRSCPGAPPCSATRCSTAWLARP
jgi:aryl-alcohol dehydrogenase-like predicted oxidoreductase